jgi:membrane protein
MPLMLRDRLHAFAERHRAARALYGLFLNLEHHNAPLAASAMAFDAFLSLVPLAAFGGFVLHLLHESGEVLIGPILRAPPKPVADLVEDAIRRLSTDSAAVIAPVSIAAFLWTSSAGLSTAMNVFETIFRSPPRVWYVRRAVAMLCVIAMIAIVAAVTAVGIGAAMISRPLGAFAAFVLPTATLGGMLSAFLRIAVRGDLVFRRRRVLPGVAVTLVLWTIVSAAFSFYVSTLSRYTTLYGGLAAVAIFLFWLWLLALALLVGGEVNAQLDGIRDDPGGGTPWPRP